MRLHSFEHVYQHDWDTVTAAFWVKYPNRLQPHVQRVDTLERVIDAQKKTFSTKRLISLRYNIPIWVQRLLGTTANGYGLEAVTCNFDDRILRLESENITFSDFLKVKEVCEYQVHPENPNWTIYRQSAWYSVSGFCFASDTLEKLAIQAAQDKSSKGLNAMQRKIIRLEETNWNEKYKSAKRRAEIVYWRYSETLNGYMTSFAKLLMGDLFNTFCRFKTAKQKLLTLHGNYGTMLTDAAKFSKLEAYEQAKAAYNEALKAVESNLKDVCINTRKFFNFGSAACIYSPQSVGGDSAFEKQSTQVLHHINWFINPCDTPRNLETRVGLFPVWKTMLAHGRKSSQDKLFATIRNSMTVIPSPWFSIFSTVYCSNVSPCTNSLQQSSLTYNEGHNLRTGINRSHCLLLASLSHRNF